MYVVRWWRLLKYTFTKRFEVKSSNGTMHRRISANCQCTIRAISVRLIILINAAITIPNSKPIPDVNLSMFLWENEMIVLIFKLNGGLLEQSATESTRWIHIEKWNALENTMYAVFHNTRTSTKGRLTRRMSASKSRMRTCNACRLAARSKKKRNMKTATNSMTPITMDFTYSR